MRSFVFTELFPVDEFIHKEVESVTYIPGTTVPN